VKGRNPRAALSLLAEQRFTRGADMVTAYSREIHPLRPGTDSRRGHARRRRLERSPPLLITSPPEAGSPPVGAAALEDGRSRILRE
jgi:hypothetical protein